MTSIVDPNNLALTTRISYDSTTGLVTSTTTPAGNSAGTTPSTRKTVYYRNGTGSGFSDCDNRAEWALLPCRIYAAAQPASGNEIPYTLTTYDMHGESRTIVTKNSTATLRTVTIDRDTAGRPTDVSFNSASGTAVAKRHFVYDQVSGLVTGLQTLDGTGTVTASLANTRDALGRVTSYTDASGNVSSTSYDVLSRPAVTNDGKASQTATYNGGGESRGLPTQIVDSQAGTLAVAYGADGNVQTETQPDGLTVRHYYNETGRPTGLEYVTNPSCADAACTLYYDYVGSNSHGETRWKASSFSNDGYGFDYAGRLTGARQDLTNGCTLRTYGLDSATNRTSAVTYTPDSQGNCQDTVPSVSKTWSYDGADRVSKTGYTYDTLGRTLTMPNEDAPRGTGDVTLSYYSNDMTRSISQGATITTSDLDVNTTRIGTITTNSGGSVTTRTNHFADNGDSPAWTSEGSSYTRNIQGLSGLVALYLSAQNQTVWKITDLHGDIVASHVGNTVGVQETYQYDEFGRTMSSNAPSQGWHGRSSRYTETQTGLIGMGARTYNPTTGRFLSTDPIYGGNDNAYNYPGNPVDQRDLDGLSAFGSTPIGTFSYSIAGVTIKVPTGCFFSHYINGSGQLMNYERVGTDCVGPGFYSRGFCNYRFTVRYYNVKGAQYTSRSSPLVSKCAWSTLYSFPKLKVLAGQACAEFIVATATRARQCHHILAG